MALAFPYPPQAAPKLTVAQDGGAVEFERGVADVSAFDLGPSHAGPDPFDDKVSFEFGDCADDFHGAAQRTASLESFLRAGSANLIVLYELAATEDCVPSLD